MSAELAVLTLLKNAAAVAALVGARIYPLTAPQPPTYPLVTFQRISGVRWRSLSGPSGMAQPRIQVDAYATTYAGAKALATAVRQTLDGYRGPVQVTSGPATYVRVGGCTLESDQDLYETDVNPKLYRVSMDFLVTHDET